MPKVHCGTADLERQLSNPYDDLPKVLDEMEKEDQLGSYTEDEQLCKGRLGEAVIISKAEGVERVGIMIALLLSVTWGFMQGVDEELQKSFSTNYRYEIYHGAIVLSNGAGLFSLLLLVFLCIKIRRLSAKSMFCYSGIGGTAELKYDYLVKVHSKGMIDNLLRKASKNENAAGMKNKNDTRFFARQWYNDQTKLINGRQLYLAGLTGFILQLTTFVIATSIKLGDTGRTALPTLHAVNMAWPPAIAMGMLCAASTFSELL